MDIKTVIRAASQHFGLEKKADTGNVYAPWQQQQHRIGPIRWANRQPTRIPTSAASGPQAKAFGPTRKPTHTGDLGVTGSEAIGIGNVTGRDNSRIQDTTRTMHKVQVNTQKGQLGDIGVGEIEQSGGGMRAVDTASRSAARGSQSQFAGAPEVERTLWKPTTWDRVGDPGAYAGSNRGAEVVSTKLDKLRAAQEKGTLTPAEQAELKAEEDRVYRAQQGINSGSAINLGKERKRFKLFGKNQASVGNVYHIPAYGSFIADIDKLEPEYGIDTATNADAQSTVKPDASAEWSEPDANGIRRRKVKRADLTFDRDQRAKHLFNALYGEGSYNDLEQRRYAEMLETMSAMRNDPTYYDKTTNKWTSAALDKWRNDTAFNTIYNNIPTGSRFDREAVLNAFLGNASKMYMTNDPYTDPNKPAGL